MGWGNCGTDSRGRGIGYYFPARCDEKGCHRRIDRGLDYACGGMHGEDEVSCEGYFCEEHRQHEVLQPSGRGRTVRVCRSCAAALRKEGWVRDREEGYLRPRRR
jgi:hypothetical protein